ncbi:general stress protein CsbD [Fodinibius sediminis]|uniref:General stress protein CsbD n=1 Tax=Fodinibius sediminis TaxID=1214077 RepID=A0A521AVU6_9BACT|nr:general stress protein CsbD [Fodinibius sediminis]SMO38958.1 hypothetical protein SAMN06265218_101426 [Fodinibius sediminis]
MENKNLFKNWPERRKRLKREYPDLTEEDLAYVAGQEDELFGRLKQRLGTSREETRNILRKI